MSGTNADLLFTARLLGVILLLVLSMTNETSQQETLLTFSRNLHSHLQGSRWSSLAVPSGGEAGKIHTFWLMDGHLGGDYSC